MDCNIVKDLIPLYIDNCCSDESAAEVKTHLESCSECKTVFDEMSSPAVSDVVSAPEKPLAKINDWKASVLQSALFLISFLLITIGVAFEAGTDYIDLGNGFWAINLVAPVTGFMLSLPNWYFIKFYKNKKSFSRWSCAITVILIFAATVWSLFHYEAFVLDRGFVEFLKSCLNLGYYVLFFYTYSFIITAVLALLSKIFSAKYAEMLGKE